MILSPRLIPRAYQAGGSTFFDNRVRDNSEHFSDVATLIKGRHTMRFGGEVRIQQLNNAAHFDIGGNFNFRSNQTANTNDFNQGWPIASLITGRPEFSFNSNQTIDPGTAIFFECVLCSGRHQGYVETDRKSWCQIRLRSSSRRGARLPARL